MIQIRPYEDWALGRRMPGVGRAQHRSTLTLHEGSDRDSADLTGHARVGWGGCDQRHRQYIAEGRKEGIPGCCSRRERGWLGGAPCGGAGVPCIADTNTISLIKKTFERELEIATERALLPSFLF